MRGVSGHSLTVKVVTAVGSAHIKADIDVARSFRKFRNNRQWCIELGFLSCVILVLSLKDVRKRHWLGFVLLSSTFSTNCQDDGHIEEGEFPPHPKKNRLTRKPLQSDSSP